mmetsp:Transcript_115141/g.325367  ORF Transcript_115141/g.325367 Transcript_115141/m.325367 type:complete len:200 (-) Transcript_115141:1211-1810(-)
MSRSISSAGPSARFSEGSSTWFPAKSSAGFSSGCSIGLHITCGSASSSSSGDSSERLPPSVTSLRCVRTSSAASSGSSSGNGSIRGMGDLWRSWVAPGSTKALSGGTSTMESLRVCAHTALRQSNSHCNAEICASRPHFSFAKALTWASWLLDCCLAAFSSRSSLDFNSLTTFRSLSGSSRSCWSSFCNCSLSSCMAVI